MNIDKLKLLWVRNDKPQPKKILKDVLYIQNDGNTIKLAEGHKGIETNWSYEGSIGFNLGARLKIVHLSLTYDFSEQEITGILGEELFEKAGSWLKKKKRKQVISYRIKPGPLIPIEVMDKLWDLVKTKLKLSHSDLMPPHPTWVYEKDLGVNFCICRMGTSKFKQILGNRLDIFYRAGKDLWKIPLITRRNVKVLVVKSVPGHDDGVMWSKSPKTFMSLVRGFTKVNDKPLLLKGRLISTELPAGSKSWPQGQYDIVTSQHNIKWGEVPHGTILNMEVQFVLNEIHSKVEKEETFFEKRKLTLLTLLVAKLNPELEGWVKKSFKLNAIKVAKSIKNFSTLAMEKLEKLFQDDQKSLIALDQALKVRLGFIQDDITLKEIRQAMMNKLRSSKVAGKWLAAIARSFVPRGTIWMSEQDKVLFLKEKGTVIRYPVTGYQSFITLKIEFRKDIPKGLAMLNGEDAKYLALDGDDHILVMKPISTFEGGEPVLSERAAAEKLDVNQLSPMGLYLSGANAQGLIGYCFNAMAKCLGKAESSPEQGEVYVALAERLGMLLDMLAQAIKKPYKLDTEVIESTSDIDLQVDEHPIASVCLKQNMDEASEIEWGVQIPLIPKQKVYQENLVAIPKEVEEILSSCAKRTSGVNLHQKYVVYQQTTGKIKSWVKKHPDLETAVKVYYSVAVQMKNDELFTGLMDGTILLVGRRLLETVPTETK